MIVIYNLMIFLSIALGLPLIIPMVLASEKRRKTVLQRLGIRPLPEVARKTGTRGPDKKPIWIHALSVGEVISAVPLVKAVRRAFRNRALLLSVSTKTGHEIANTLLKPHADALFFFPYDLRFSIRHLADKIDPAMVVLVETDIWPNFMQIMKARDVPVVLVNARLSKKSFSGYRRLSGFAKSVFSSFSKVCTQSPEDATMFEYLGVPPEKITTTGNLKFDQPVEPMTDDETASWKRLMSIRPPRKVFLAGSTHKGEENILLDAYLMIRKDLPDLFLIVAPRDPARARSVCRMFRSAGFSAALMNELDGAEPDVKFDVVIVDRLGVLRRLYALAEAAFVGGSLVERGGHNPLEPAAFSKPILFGPNMSNFSQISGMLLESKAAVEVRDVNSLHRAAVMLLTDGNKAENMGKNAFKIFHNNQGAVEKTLKVIHGCLQNRKPTLPYVKKYSEKSR